MKSRDEIVIIMLQWLRLYTLGSRGSRELKTFLETRLISSRVDQKLKNKEREIHAFKEGNWARNRGHWKRSWALFEGVMGAVLWGEDAASIPHKIDFNIASTRAQIVARSGHDRATIKP